MLWVMDSSNKGGIPTVLLLVSASAITVHASVPHHEYLGVERSITARQVLHAAAGNAQLLWLQLVAALACGGSRVRRDAAGEV